MLRCWIGSYANKEQGDQIGHLVFSMLRNILGGNCHWEKTSSEYPMYTFFQFAYF